MFQLIGYFELLRGNVAYRAKSPTTPGGTVSFCISTRISKINIVLNPGRLLESMEDLDAYRIDICLDEGLPFPENLY